jgi:hypothetical protein
LAVRQRPPSAGWDLTSRGREVAAILAAAAPEPSATDRKRAEAALAKLRDEVIDEYGPLE